MGANVPLSFLRRHSEPEMEEPAPRREPETIEEQDFVTKITYSSKSSEGVRMTAGPNALAELPRMIEDIAISPVETVEPLDVDLGHASVNVLEPEQVKAWLLARGHLSGITRHALIALETVGAFDPAYDTLALALLEGELDRDGYPRYNAIIGGVASHWDEATGDMIVRSIAAWGGHGVRGDTDRIAVKLIRRLFMNILDSTNAVGRIPLGSPLPAAGNGGLVCAHCGFAAAHQRAFYCPKCGMRLVRG
jgi:hypothetical protein